ncbi:MAG: DUF465 domain-containing protein [Alphaproteobacteria bacterium]|nr:DUF465 domain-containing protein [Alphaproteobacteria bacterium]
MENVDAEQKLVELRIEHRDLDEVITCLTETVDLNEIQLRRLKKRKLALKDQIARLESAMVPNLIA